MRCSAALCFVIPPQIKANTIIDTALFEKYIEAKQNNISKELPSNLSKGDLYKTIRLSKQQDNIIQIQEWVLATYQTITGQFPDCKNTIKTSDINTILRHTNTQYANQVENSLSFSIPWRNNQQETSLSETCQRLIQCIQNSAASINPQSTEQCTKMVNNTYAIASDFAWQNDTLINKNQEREVFDNGTLEDSSFDLLLDIQTIGDLLFSINKPTPQIVRYQLPNTQTIGGNITNNTNNSNSNSPPTTGGQGNTGTSLPDTTPPNITQAQVPYYNDSKKTGNTSIQNPQASLEDEIKQLISQQTYEQSTDWSNGITLVGNNFCQTWAIITGTTVQEEQTKREEYTNELEQYIETFDTQQRINDILLWNTTTIPINSWNSQSNEPTNTGNNDVNTDTIHDLDDIQQAQECIQQCNTTYTNEQNTCKQNSSIEQWLCAYTATTNALVCKTKCMCGISPKNTPETMQKLVTYRIRYCMVPSQPSVVAWSTKVLSIEAIVDQINAVLIALKDSGQLGKRTHVKEFLETSHQKIKLKNLIVFTINVAFKPIFNSISYQVQSAEQKEKNLKKEEKILDIHNKNKYVSLADPNSYDTKQRPIINPPQYQKLLEQIKKIGQLQQEDKEEQEKVLKREYESNIQSNIKNFLTNNELFREKTATVLEDLQSVTASLKTTVEKGK